MASNPMMVVVAVDGQRFALPLASVARVVRAVEVTPWPDAPPAMLGVIDVQGKIMPVLSLRRQFARADREIQLDDQMVIVRAGTRMVALLVDAVEGVRECEPRRIINVQTRPGQPESPGIAPGAPSREHGIGAVVKLGDDLALVPDLAALLSLPEIDVSVDALPRIGS